MSHTANQTFKTDSKRLAILEGIARGERALTDGKVVSHDEAKDKMSKWLK